jgi:DNA-binding winged helix-turn-helix (wHTH) protein
LSDYKPTKDAKLLPYLDSRDNLKYNFAMNHEVSPQQAWEIIQEKHKKLALKEYTLFLQTGRLDNMEGTNHSSYTVIYHPKNPVIYTSDQRVLSVGKEKKARLTKLEHQLYTLLLDSPGRLFTHQDIYTTIYTEDHRPYENIFAVETLRPVVARLREKLDIAHVELRNTVESVRGEGYIYLPHPSLAQ